MKELLSNVSLLTSSHVIDGGRHNFVFRIAALANGTLVGHVSHRQQGKRRDDEGAMYYVVAVIFLYGLSILMIIASHIRKNKSDRRLNKYLKEMAHLRKREFQMQLYTIAAGAVGNTKGDKLISATAAGDGVGSKSGKAKVMATSSLQCLPQHKTKVALHSFNSHKMVLELPSFPYTTTDSDNETSTEGDYCPSPVFLKYGSGSEGGSFRSKGGGSSRKSSVVSFVDSEKETGKDSFGVTQKVYMGRSVEDSYTPPGRATPLGRRNSLSSVKETHTLLARRASDGYQRESRKVSLALEMESKQDIQVITKKRFGQASELQVVEEKAHKSVRLMVPKVDSPEETGKDRDSLRNVLL